MAGDDLELSVRRERYLADEGDPTPSSDDSDTHPDKMDKPDEGGEAVDGTPSSGCSCGTKTSDAWSLLIILVLFFRARKPCKIR